MIVNGSQCSGCGVCEGICRKECISISRNKFGEYHTSIDSSRCINCGLCSRVCRHTQEITTFHTSKGNCFIGQAPDIPRNASSGGLATWFLCELLKNNIVDAVLCVKAAPDCEELYRYEICSSIEEVVAGAGTAYCPVHLGQVLKLIREAERKRFAIIGLPCFIAALDNLRTIDARYRDKITVLLGLVCGGLPARMMTEVLCWSAGYSNADLKTVRYHIRDGKRPAWNYGIELNFKDGKSFSSFGDEDFGFVFWQGLFLPRACNDCQDILAAKADVVFMDAWLPEYKASTSGNSLVLCRNAELAYLFDSLIKTGNIKQAPPELALEAQTALIAKRTQAGKNEKVRLNRIQSRVRLLCQRFRGDKDIISKLRMIKFTEMQAGKRPFFYLLLRLKQFLIWRL